MINIVLRRTAWALLVFCLSFSAVANEYHPHIVKSEVVVLNAKAIEGYANSGTPFELVLGGNPLKVVLAPEPVWPKEGLPVLEYGKGGATERTVQGNITYAGEVEGEDPEESEARFTIAGGVLDGYVLSSTGWWFIEPLSRFDPRAGSAEYLVYATRDLDFVLDYGDDGVKLDRVSTPRGPVRDPWIGLVMVADEAYMCLRGDGLTVHERHTTLLNQINGIYKRETGREFKLAQSVSYVGSALPSTNAFHLVNEFSSFVVTQHILDGNEKDIAHLTTARNLDGDVLGIADGGGDIGVSQQGVVRLAVAGTTQWALARLLSYQNMMVAAHEIGHNFGGEHALADKWCAWDTWVGCLDYERSIMWPAYYPDNNARFSDGTRDPMKNNKKVVREQMTNRFVF